MPIRAPALAAIAWAAVPLHAQQGQQARLHSALVRHPPTRVLTWAVDGLQ